MGPRWQYADQHYNFAITQEEGLRVVCVREREHTLEKDCAKTRKGGKVLRRWEDGEDRRQQVTSKEPWLSKTSINKFGSPELVRQKHTFLNKLRTNLDAQDLFFFLMLHFYSYLNIL